MGIFRNGCNGSMAVLETGGEGSTPSFLICTKCNNERVLSKWTTWCKKCVKQYDKERYPKTREKRRAQALKWRSETHRTNTTNIVRYLKKHPCVDCGEKDILVLEFDHRNRATKLFDVCSGLESRTWALINSEIEKCDIRCANCHRRKTVIENGSYRTLA